MCELSAFVGFDPDSSHGETDEDELGEEVGYDGDSDPEAEGEEEENEYDLNSSFINDEQQDH